MPYREDPDPGAAPVDGAARHAPSPDWRHGLPALFGREVTLRELRTADAPPLHAHLSTEEVVRFIAPLPATVEAWEQFILWTHRQRAEGSYFCYAVVPQGQDDPAGLFQVRQLEPGFGTADWEFALGFSLWGSGVFEDAAHLVARFVFDVVRARRLEGRCAATNYRGNGALKKIGATQEGILRKSLSTRHQYVDQILWTIIDDDWRRMATTGRSRGVH